MTLLDPKTLKVGLTAFVEAEFDTACREFKRLPASEIWTRLENAMYALQSIRYLKEEEVADFGRIPLGELTLNLAMRRRQQENIR